MILHLTYCSHNKSKKKEELPALDRYLSDRIQQVSEQAKEKEEQFAILSGKYGLLEPEEQIPYYDKLLKKQHLPEMIPEVEKQLQQRELKKVIYYTREVENERLPYYQLIKHACQNQGIKFQKKQI